MIRKQLGLYYAPKRMDLFEEQRLKTQKIWRFLSINL